MLIESQKDHYEPLGHYRPMTWRLGVRVGLTVRFRSSLIKAWTNASPSTRHSSSLSADLFYRPGPSTVVEVSTVDNVDFSSQTRTVLWFRTLISQIHRTERRLKSTRIKCS